MMDQEHLQLMSFKMDDDLLEEIFARQPIYYLSFPKEWIKKLEEKDGKLQSHIKYQLNNMLKLTFPTIFYTNVRTNRYWLLSLEPIELSLIDILGKRTLRRFLDEVPTITETEVLKWRTLKSVEELEEKVHFNWIPAFFAKQFCDSGGKHMFVDANREGEYHYPILDRTLSFHFVKYHGTYECMSEVIERKDEAGRVVGNFSYVVKFEYKTRALLPEKGILNVKFNIRRYTEKGIKKIENLRYRRHGSIFVQLDSPFSSVEKSFFQMQYERTKDKVIWTYRTRQWIEHLATFRKIDLNPQHILENPLSYREKDPLALPVFSHQVFYNRNVTRSEDGVSLREKYALFQLVKETFPFLTLLPKGREVPSRLSNASLTPFIELTKAIKRIRVEVWGPSSLKEQFIEENREFFEQSNSSQTTFTLQTEKSSRIEVEFVQIKEPKQVIKEIGDYEDDKVFIARTLDYLQEIEVPENTITVSLVEILRQNDYGTKNDPKQLLRESFARTGRITQFIHPLEGASVGEKKARLHNSFKDLLADLGLIPQRLRAMMDEETIIFSIGKLSRGKYFTPVISCFSKHRPLLVKVYGKEWQGFPDALLQMTEFKTHPFDVNKNKQNYHIDKHLVEKFILHHLKEIVTGTNKRVIVAFDGFFRRYFDVVKNAEIKNIKETIKSKGFQPYIDQMRFVRVNHSDEIPQYKLWDKQTYFNFNSGLYTTNDHIYYSIAQRPDSMRDNTRKTKYGSPESSLVHQSIVEFMTLGCETKEERDEVAKIMHHLRRLPITGEKGTIYPYPLHLYRALEKYIPTRRRKSRVKLS